MRHKKFEPPLGDAAQPSTERTADDNPPDSPTSITSKSWKHDKALDTCVAKKTAAWQLEPANDADGKPMRVSYHVTFLLETK